MYYAMQAFGLYKESETASALKVRDYKDATDLIGGGYRHGYCGTQANSNRV